MTDITADRNTLRLSGSLTLVGVVVLTVLVLFVHPGGGATEADTFAINAASQNWTAIHVAQFFAVALILAGLLMLFRALDAKQGAARWASFFGAIAAGVALALAGVQYAVDGVANKQAEDVWASAPAAEKTARFASAQAIRWLEWGINSYQYYLFGLALVLLAIVIVSTAYVPRPIGYLAGASGIAILVVGWLIGTKGYTSANTLPTDIAYTLLFAATIWLLVFAWRMKEPALTASQATSGSAVQRRAGQEREG